MTNKISILMILVFFALIFDANAQSQPKKCAADETSYNLPCMKQELDLADSKIKIKVYTKTKPGKIINRTFVVVHNNESKGLDAAKKVISENYGRLVEVESNYEEGYNVDDPGNERRYLYFANGKHCIDPNRIYSTEGITKALTDSKCSGTPQNPDTNKLIKSFADKLMPIITVGNTHKFIIGVHNNTNNGGLTLSHFSGSKIDAKTAVGIFRANTAAKNSVIDDDDFILVSHLNMFGKISALGKYFNLVLQEDKNYLDTHPETDDGSMSIYFGRKTYGGRAKLPFYYINIEAEGKDNNEGVQKERQKEAIFLVIDKIKL